LAISNDSEANRKLDEKGSAWGKNRLRDKIKTLFFLNVEEEECPLGETNLK
jgi:hypothetical protein